MLVGTALGHHVLREGEFLVAVVELVLLHGYLRVAQHVLLLGKLALGIENLQVEVGVAELHDDITLADVRSFIHHLFQYDASFLRTDLHHGDGSHLSIHRHIVIKLRPLHLSDTQSLPVYPEGGREIAHAEPYEQGDEHCPSCYPCPVLAGHKILLLFYLYVHSLIVCQYKGKGRAKSLLLLTTNKLAIKPHQQHCPIIRHSRLIIGQNHITRKRFIQIFLLSTTS